MENREEPAPVGNVVNALSGADSSHLEFTQVRLFLFSLQESILWENSQTLCLSRILSPDDECGEQRSITSHISFIPGHEGFPEHVPSHGS